MKNSNSLIQIDTTLLSSLFNLLVFNTSKYHVVQSLLFSHQRANLALSDNSTISDHPNVPQLQLEVSSGLMKDSFSDSKGEIQSKDSSEPCLTWMAAGTPRDTVARVMPQAKPALLGTFHLRRLGEKKALTCQVFFYWHREATSHESTEGLLPNILQWQSKKVYSKGKTQRKVFKLHKFKCVLYHI